MNFAVDRVFQSSDWMVLMFSLVFALLAIVKLFFSKRLSSLLGCFFSKNYFLDYASELQEKFSLFHFLLFLVQNLIGALFVYVFVLKFGGSSKELGFGLYAKLFSGLTLYLLLQVILSKLVATLFRADELFDGVFVLKFSYLKVVSIYSFPVLLLWVYSYPESRVMSLIAVVYVLTLLVVRWILIIVNKITLFKINSFYFILYICTLEILPLVLLLKLMVQ
ncbi:DUF4271 domain-containing protein [Bacteroidota bacterium]